MASLTPGTLQKLLQNVGNQDFKVAGDHRSALLQVISIVPSIEDDPWNSRGYYLRVSDSLHSAYVSVSDEDVDLILSDKLQLGQFIHATRLDSASPVPVLRGVKPIPKRRPCVGEPKDLISSDFLNAKKVETKVKPKVKVKKVVGNEESNLRRLSFGNGKAGGGAESRRLSLDSARKGWGSSPQSKNGVGSALKPHLKDGFSRLDSVVVKMVIPDDSPKRSSFSSSIKSKKAIPEDSPKSSSCSSFTRSTKATPEDSPRSSICSPLKSKNVIVSPKPPTKPVQSMKLTRPVKSSKQPVDEVISPVDLNKVPLASKLKISWDALPSAICDLGKEVRSYRNVAYGYAVRALEETSIYDDVNRCMSMLAELCELSRKDTSGPLVEQFLNIHESLKKASIVINTLIHSKTSNSNDSNDYRSESGICFTPASNNASLWVQAAVQTDLSKFSLYKQDGDKGIENGEKCHYVVIENAPQKIDTEKHSPKIKQNPVSSGKSVPRAKEVTSHSRPRLSTNIKETIPVQQAWSSRSGLKDVANLAEKLLLFSRSWFLDYMEASLNNGFGLSRDEGPQITVLLGQLRRVNQWLDDAFRGDRVDERIERLRKKLYRYLLDHVDSAVSHR